MSNNIFVVGDKTITVGIDDYRALKAIESAFTANVITNHAQGKDAAFTAFRKNLKVAEAFQLVARRKAWQIQDSKGLRGKPVEQAKALAAYCDSAVAPLNRTFGEEAMLIALPDGAKDERIADVCRALGANKLAALCDKVRNAP